MKKLLYIAILLIFVSCQKEYNIEQPHEILNLNVSSNFDWKTSKEISLNVIGIKEIDTTISNILYVKSSVGDTVYYKDFLKMSKDYDIKFVVPSTETKVILVYGSKTKMIELQENKISFDYITE